MPEQETIQVVKGALALANAAKITKLLVHLNSERIAETVAEIRGSLDVIWLHSEESAVVLPDSPNDFSVKMPESHLTRMSQIHLGLFLALVQGYVRREERIVCLSGDSGSERLDTIHITSPRRDFPWFRGFETKEQRKKVITREFGRLLSIALRLAAEGREGRAIGTAFILGEPEELEQYTHQLVLNPCKGHSRRLRNIHDPQVFETIREFSALDGAFVVSRKGVVESAGVYVDAPAGKARLRSGWGARHTSAAALTSIVDCITIVVSESSGTVTVFHHGKVVLELERLAHGKE